LANMQHSFDNEKQIAQTIQVPVEIKLDGEVIYQKTSEYQYDTVGRAVRLGG